MNFANSTVSQKQSNAERLMRCIIYSSHWLRTILLFVVKSVFYILTLAWGFRRCSFRLTGQCEGLSIVERVTEPAPRFFVCISEWISSTRESVGFIVYGIRMNILQNNPYRLLGVYSNSPTKERLANHNRMKAFLKVGKSVSFPLDVPQYLSSINRTEASAADAEAKLTLPKDQILHAQFWFIKTTPLDEVAFNHLFAGEIDKAEEIWQKRECLSALQNRIVCALIRNRYDSAIKCAEVLYGNTQYLNQFVSTIIGTGGNFDVSNLAFSFLDILCDEIGASKLLPFIANSSWKEHIGEKAVKPLIDSIQEAINIAQKTKGKGSNARLNAGETLRRNTRNAILQLKGFLSTKDLQYQIIADKLGLEILQCGIDYYNDSEEPDAAHKAMSLQKYAKSIVVGQMAKDRCKENVDILQKIIDNLPPAEVFAEDRAIKEELRKYCQLPDKICHAVTLLKKTRPYLLSIKQKMGADNAYYLKITTQVIGNALHNIIEEVNEAQKYDPAKERRRMIKELEGSILGIRTLGAYPLDDFLYEQEDKRKKYEHIKISVLSAREALLLIDDLEMEKDFEQKRYLPNRATLNSMLVQFGSSLPKYKPVPLRKKVAMIIEHIVEKIKYTDANDVSQYVAKLKKQTSEWMKENYGCIISVSFLLFTTIVGASVNGSDGAGAGFLIGLAILVGILKLFDI